MIERIENLLQVAVLLFCIVCAAIRALRTMRREWCLLSLFCGSWLLGDIYWLVCIVFYGDTPKVSVVCDLSWYAAYIFLYMLLRQAVPPRTRLERRALPWLAPVFTAAMATYYMQWGSVASNLIYAALMGLLLFACIRRLMDGDGVPLCAAILVICLLEYALWTASCLFEGDTLKNPYYWCDILLTASFPLLIPATQRVVAA